MNQIPGTEETDPEPNDPIKRATLFDISFSMQLIYDLQRAEIGHLQYLIEKLEWQLGELTKKTEV